MLRSYFPLLYFTIILSFAILSCTDNSKTEKEVIKAMEESLNYSNKAINKSSLTITVSLKEKFYDPLTSYKAERWYPKAKQIQNLSKSCYDYIDSLKKEPSLSLEKSTVLFKTLQYYKADILNIDSYIRKEFNDATLISIAADSTNISAGVFFDTFFRNSSKKSTHAFLTKLQNNVKLLENRTIAFCNDQISNPDHYYDSYYAIIGQNSQVVEKGKEIEITAGVGSFSRASKAIITINKQNIPLNEEGVSLYKIKTSNNPGKYKLPVRIQFTDVNGKEQIIEKNVEYTVAKECDQ